MYGKWLINRDIWKWNQSECWGSVYGVCGNCGGECGIISHSCSCSLVHIVPLMREYFCSNWCRNKVLNRSTGENSVNPMVLRSILVDLQSYKSILYSFNLLYNVFRSIFSNCAALLLLFPVWRSASKICSFSVSSLRSAILVLLLSLIHI